MKIRNRKSRSHDEKSIRKFRLQNTKELEWKLRFLTIKNRKLSDYEEEKKAREMARKTMEEIDGFETKIKNMWELLINII